MHPLYKQADVLSGEVIDAAIVVHEHFGIGLLENIYKMCLAHELRLRGHEVDVEFKVPVRYKDFTYDQNLRVDLLVDKCLIVECKSLDEEKINMQLHRSQTLSYLKLLNKPLGLVINFSDYRLKKHRGIARVILAGADKPDPGEDPFSD